MIELQQQERQAQNWEGNVLVPLVENGAGGGAAAVVLATLT